VKGRAVGITREKIKRRFSVERRTFTQEGVDVITLFTQWQIAGAHKQRMTD